MRVLTILIASTLTSFAGLPAAAQQPDPAPGGNTVRSEEPKEVLISVDFPGGSVADYINVLRRSVGKVPVNAVVSAQAQRATLSPIVLRDVSLFTAMSAISAAAGNSSGNWLIEVIPGQTRAMAALAFSVDYKPRAERPADELVVETLSLARLIGSGKAEQNDGMSAAVVLTAIETGLQLGDGAGARAPELKFHEESGLLFVRGTVPEVRLVQTVVNRMSDDLERRRAIAQRDRELEQQRSIAVREAGLMVQLRESELTYAESCVTNARQQAAGGFTSAAEVAQTEMEFQRAKIGLEQAKLQRERATMTGAPPSGLRPAESGDKQVGTGAAREDLIAQLVALQQRVASLENELKASRGNAVPAPGGQPQKR